MGSSVRSTEGADQLARDYDQFTVHGHLLADTPGSGLKGTAFSKGPLAIQIDRYGTDDEIARIDALHAFLIWAVGRGATVETTFWSPVPGMVSKGEPLGKFAKRFAPSLFKKTPRKRAA